eukprot:scpid47403/ scgid26253/ 
MYFADDDPLLLFPHIPDTLSGWQQQTSTSITNIHLCIDVWLRPFVVRGPTPTRQTHRWSSPILAPSNYKLRESSARAAKDFCQSGASNTSTLMLNLVSGCRANQLLTSVH